MYSLNFCCLTDGTVERKRSALSIAHRSGQRPSPGIVTELTLGRFAVLSDRFGSRQLDSHDDNAPSAVSGIGQHHTHGTIER